MVDIGGNLKVLVDGFRWRRMGDDGAGRRLLDRVGGDDEQTRTLAGMAIVRAGERSVGLIEAAIQEGTVAPQAVKLLADIGGERARAVLDAAASQTGPTAESAAEALDLLRRIDQLDDEDGRGDATSL